MTRSRNSNDPRIAIVGAGLGGLSLAAGLHANGRAATIFEKDRDGLERSIGGSLDMHPDTGLYAIRRLGLFDRFAQIARFEDQGMHLYDRDAKPLFEFDDGNRPEIDRGQLRRLLLSSIPTEWFRWDHDLEDVREAASGGFELRFRGGRKEYADVVIGADGVWSRVRPFVSRAEPRYSGLTFFEFEIRDVERDHPEVARFVARGLTMALAENKLISAQRNATGHVRLYAALFVAEDGKTPSGHPTVTARSREEIVAEFAGWSETLVHLFESAEDAVRPWPIYTMPIGHRWAHRIGVTAIGDAAHAMPPAGDGANLAMRDGVDLADAIADANGYDGAVAAFEAAMFERAKDSAAIASAVLLEGSSEDRIALIKEAISPAA